VRLLQWSPESTASAELYCRTTLEQIAPWKTSFFPCGQVSCDEIVLQKMLLLGEILLLEGLKRIRTDVIFKKFYLKTILKKIKKKTKSGKL
jgi:hypothetical protein